MFKVGIVTYLITIFILLFSFKAVSHNDDNHGRAFSHDEIDLFTRNDKSE